MSSEILDEYNDKGSDWHSCVSHARSATLKIDHIDLNMKNRQEYTYNNDELEPQRDEETESLYQKRLDKLVLKRLTQIKYAMKDSHLTPLITPENI